MLPDSGVSAWCPPWLGHFTPPGDWRGAARVTEATLIAARMRIADRVENTEVAWKKIANSASRCNLFSERVPWNNNARASDLVGDISLDFGTETLVRDDGVDDVSVAEAASASLKHRTDRWAATRGPRKLKKMPARNIVSNEIPNSKVRYSRLSTEDDGYTDLQVRQPAMLRIPAADARF